MAARKPSSSSKTKAAKSAPRRRAASKKTKKRQSSWFKRLCLWVVIGGIWAFIIVTAYVAYVALKMPQISSWEIPVRPPNVKIVDVHERLIANRGATGGEAVDLDEISVWIPKAVVAIEDQRFYDHFGIDIIGIGRAAVNNLTRKQGLQGGSTLTQQLAKNLFLSNERTLERKVQEALLALWLEHKYSKDEILTMYLNRVYLGSGAYGVSAAARRYFDKSAADVTLMEAATLAGLLIAPSRLSPANNPQAARDRAVTVLESMRQQGIIDEVQMTEALAQPMIDASSWRSGSHNYVADQVVRQLPYLIGEAQDDVLVYTTIDLDLQQKSEEALRKQIAENERQRNVHQAALISMNMEGAIVALVGGVDYARSQFNRATEAHRQPGSAFKPFVYLAALEAGRTPNSMRNDAPVKIGNWTPRNYSGKYQGQVTLTTALSHSLNSVAAQLVMEVGPQTIIKTAQRLGIHSPLENNASLALGTSDVSLLEITDAFIPFANGGYRSYPRLINLIVDKQGNVLYRADQRRGPRVIDEQVVTMMNAMLQQTVLQGTAKGAQIGRPAAGKTGTSQNFRDAWFIGYTGNLVTGIWFGNDDGAPMKNVSGGGLPVRVWHDYMKYADYKFPPRNLDANYQLRQVMPGGNDLLPDMGAATASAPQPMPEQDDGYWRRENYFPPPPTLN